MQDRVADVMERVANKAGEMRGQVQEWTGGGEEVVVGWGTLALINAALAQGKNRSGLGWFLLSLLLGPIATFLLCVVSKRPGG